MKRIASLFAAGIVLILSASCYGQNIWKLASGTPVGPISAFALDRSGNVLAITNNGLYRSTDNALTWQTINITLPAYDPYFLGVDSLGNIYIDGNGLFRSNDNGLTWTQHRSGLGDTNYGIFVHSFAAMDSMIFVGTDEGSTESGLYCSSDRGDSWLKIDSLYHGSIAADSHENVFVTSQNGIFRSSDNGKSWLPANTGIPDSSVWSIVATTKCLFAVDGSPYYSGARLYESTNDGASWALVPTSEDAYCVAGRDSSFVWGTWHSKLAFSAGTKEGSLQKVYNGTSEPEIWAVTICPNGRLLAATYGDGFYASDDSGKSWHQAQTGLMTAVMPIVVGPNGNVYGCANGMFRTSNDGNTWERIDSDFKPFQYPYSDQDPTVITAALNSQDHLFVFAGHNFRSTDSARTWNEIDTGFSKVVGFLMGTSAYAINSNDEIFAGTKFGGVFRTTDEGDTWQKASSGMMDFEVTDLAVDRRGILYALTRPGVGDGSIYRSEDNGDQWTNVCTDLTQKASGGDTSWLSAITIAPNGSVFVGTTNDGLFRSTNSGNTWMPLYPALQDLSITALAADSDGNIFASSYQSVYASTNNGDAWFNIGGGLSASFQSMAVKKNGTVFGAGSEVYRLDSLSVNALNVSPELQREMRISNSPNPFQQSTTISFALPESYYISLTLSDATGREVRQIASGYFDSGEHSVEFARGTLPAGVYFYRLEAGGQSVTRAMVVD